MDGFCLKMGIPPAISVSRPLENRTNATQVSPVGRSLLDKKKSTPPATVVPSRKTAFSRLSCRYRLKALWAGTGNGTRYNEMTVDDTVLLEDDNGGEEKVNEGNLNGGETNGTPEGQNRNWVMKILDVKSLWREKEGEPKERNNENDIVNEEDEICEFCSVCEDEDDEDENEIKEIEINKHTFSKMLKRVSLADAKLYAQMSYLGCLAYRIPKIKPESLLRRHGLRLVTSSIQRRESTAKAEKNRDQISAYSKNQEAKGTKGDAEGHEQRNMGNRISASAAYQIAASAASYLQSHTRIILPFKSANPESIKGCSSNDDNGSDSGSVTIDPDVASLMATTDSVTAVVAAKEEVKQAVADGLNSTHSSPCEWFICDDDQTATRWFVIQGSESLASWQANLLFEPIQFEGLDVLVHRGIYEAAKGIYEQMLPEVRSHLKCHGYRATFRFTGHSLGGSLSLLVNLMLLIRGEVPASSLLPVIMFGSPNIMWGGDRLLRQLGLPRNHVQAITMHRDIVPRAFSCNFPDHVVELLKAINGKLRHHPCLTNQKLLYAPMGQFLILQPNEKLSPHHHLLPSGTGLYFLSCPLSSKDGDEKLIRAALRVFFNSPHPLDILSDLTAYGSEGTILRDHDMKSYLKSIRDVIRQEQNRIRKTKREQRRKDWWSLLFQHGINVNIILRNPIVTIGSSSGQEQFNLAGVLQTGRISLKRFGKLVTSLHMHLLVILLFPAKLLLLGAYHVHAIRFR